MISELMPRAIVGEYRDSLSPSQPASMSGLPVGAPVGESLLFFPSRSYCRHIALQQRLRAS
jgi:hypothetical protein